MIASPLIHDSTYAQATFKEAVFFFSQHHILLSLLEKVTVDEFLGIEGVDPYLRRTFEQFAIEFSTEAKQLPEIANFFLRYSQAISFSISLRYRQEIRTKASFQKNNFEYEFNEDIMNALLELESEADFGSEDVRHRLENYQEPTHNSKTKLPDLLTHTVREFISESKAMHNLVNRFKKLTQPPFIMIANHLIKTAINVGKPGSINNPVYETHLISLVAELNYSNPASLKIDTKQTKSWIDFFKISLEDATTKGWNWWPFLPPRRPLGPGEARVNWICVSRKNQANNSYFLMILRLVGNDAGKTSQIDLVNNLRPCLKFGTVALEIVLPIHFESKG